MSERGERPPVVGFRSKKLYGAEKFTPLPITEMRPEYASRAEKTGHGGADFVLFDKLFAALRSPKRKSPITIKEGLLMTLPGIYASRSAAAGGAVTRIAYPWEKEFIR